MTALSALQNDVVGEPPEVPEGIEAPGVPVVIHDLGDIGDESDRDGGWLRRFGPTFTDDEVPSVVHWLAVYRKDGRWFFHHESRGGSGRSIGYEDRADAVAEAHRHAAQSVAFWMEKVTWRLAGDLAAPARWERRRESQSVVRCGGVHYVIGHEPSASELRSNRQHGGLGFGGRQFAFRMLDDGRRVQSNNVWYQGRIPREFLDLLPDNAEQVDSDEVIAQRARAEAFAEERAAERQARAWADEACRAWRGVDRGRHEIVMAWAAAEPERKRHHEEEYEATRLAERWAQEAARSWRGSWSDLEVPLREEWEAFMEEWDVHDEMMRDYYGGGR